MLSPEERNPDRGAIGANWGVMMVTETCKTVVKEDKRDTLRYL